ncbi:MAG: ABC transporter ATP-binding protein/permease [Synergistaceae bacterium]|jgi:ATP-binding cassette subfamily B protein|nr:ABC transporter ATP-binding protein/permease [Synergistaceae bacterium]
MTEETNKKHQAALLWKLSRGSRALYAVAFASMLMAVACNFMTPQLIRYLVDSVSGAPVERMPIVSSLVALAGLAPETVAQRGNMARVVMLVIAVSAFGGIFNLTYRRSLVMGAEGLVKRLRDRLYSHIQRLPYSWHITIQTGDIVQRCTSDVEIVRSFVSNQLIEIVRAISLAVFAYCILFSMNVPMAAASLAFLPIVFVYSFIFLRDTSIRFLAADEAEGQLLAIAQENFSGVRVVRAFGRERYEADRFASQNQLYAELWMKLGKMLSTYWAAGDMLTGLQMIAICVTGIYQASRGGITIGEFMVFLTYNAMIIWPVRGLGRVLAEAGKTFVSLGRLEEIFNSPTESDPESALDAPIAGDIEFDHVSFAYENAPILRDVSFTVSEGTTLGILGATGSGKTTVAHLLCRLYDLGEGEGEIRIGGVDIRRLKRSLVRKSVGIVLQEPFLYSRTIAENVASLSKHYSLEQIKEAASISQVDDAIEQFAHNYDTLVGERGVTLSGGQKQRVAIARTILKAPPIMIFDDSLSAVDTETDSRIRAALRDRVRGVTTIIISHRITSISGADKIIVMENGRIIEMGSPAELETFGGVYGRILDTQRLVVDETDEGGDRT